MKVLVFGDGHGRTYWEHIIKDEQPDLTIFLGDYVSSHEDISGEQQVMNMENILNYKKENPDKCILLRGNHDLQHLGYYWAETCSYNHLAASYMKAHKDEFLENSQWVYINDEHKIIFSHAGISTVWLKNSHIEDIHDINSYEPSELFAFTSNRFSDYCGESTTQPPTWIRPGTLISCCYPGYTQVVGHTPVKRLVNLKDNIKDCQENIWLCDTLFEQYLVIEDWEKFTVKPNKYLL